jgi:hypothetical protein
MYYFIRKWLGSDEGNESVNNITLFCNALNLHIEVLLLVFGLWGYWQCGHSWPIVPASGDSEDDCAEADGM